MKIMFKTNKLMDVIDGTDTFEEQGREIRAKLKNGKPEVLKPNIVSSKPLTTW